MFIRCPRCETGYSIPDKQLSDKPRKMRCNRCKTVFTVARRSGSPPRGYEEFTGKQSALPSEFAFLRQTPSEAPPPAVVIESEQPVLPSQDPTMVGHHQPGTQLQKDSTPPPAAPAEETAPVEQPSDKPEITDAEIEEAISRAKWRTAKSAAQSAPSTIETPAQVTPPETAPVVAATIPQDATPSQGSTVPEFYGGSSSAWEMEAPLDLEGFAVQSPTGGGQLVGKLMTVFLVIVAGFFVFVAYRNNWDLSFAELPKQIDFAFSNKATDRLPDEVKGLEVTVEDSRILMRKRKSPLLIVTGKVFNNSLIKLSHIVLRGRVYDASGEMRVQTRIPCDKLFEDTDLKKKRKGAITRAYRKGGTLHDCTIRGNSSTLFELIFENPPPDYDETFRVEVKPVSARPSS
ncbi:MAG: hypothetical protein GY854_30380 [Deltaproteobacteria bacterium]|nr:hypothetical protein [Deltaproteobacteria bacterium]